MISKFLKNSSLVRPPPHFVVPQAAPVLVNRFEYLPAKYQSPADFYSQFNPCHTKDDQFPQCPTDIKGIDAGAYSFIHKQKAFSRLPKLAPSRFIQLKYFPDFHYLALSRKSNISLASFNETIPMMNDPVLNDALKSYQGPLKNMQFFKERSHPYTKASSRSKFRKLVKRCLFKSICHTSDIALVRGFYFYHIKKLPESLQDKVELASDIDKSIQIVINDVGYRNTLVKVTRELNRLGLARQLINLVTPTNTLHEDKLPLYYPKLPFIKNVLKLI